MHLIPRVALLLLALGPGCRLPALQSPESPGSQADAAALKRARELRAQHKLEAAMALLQQYAASHPGDAATLTLLAEIRIDAGDTPRAEHYLAQALQADPDSREANLLAGKLLLSQQHVPEAMDRFETILNKSPHDEAARKLELEAVTTLAAGAAQAGNPEAALKALQHARTKMPDDSRLLMELGLQALDLKLFGEAEEALQAARRTNPADADVTYASARLELEEQHMPQAEADLRAYLAARPNDASAHFGLGRVLAMEQRDDEARKEFQRSVQLQPVQTESYYQLGRLDLNAHRNEAAEASFQRVIGRDPKHGGALAGLGEIAFRAKNYPLANEYLSRAVEAAPDYGPAHYYRGLTLNRLGRKAEADQELQTATQLGEAAAAPVHGASAPASHQ